MKDPFNLLREAFDIFDSKKKPWEQNKAYAEGFDRAKREYGESRGVAHCHRATQEEVEMHGVELWGWCDCRKPIEGRWVGMANFCPWCRKVMEWGEKHENRD